jgi:hypothetical protein
MRRIALKGFASAADVGHDDPEEQESEECSCHVTH